MQPTIYVEIDCVIGLFKYNLRDVLIPVHSGHATVHPAFMWPKAVPVVFHRHLIRLP